MKLVKKILIGIACFLVILVIALSAIRWHFVNHYFDGYDHLAPLNDKISETSEKPDYIRTVLHFDGNKGDVVPTLLATPKEAKGPLPCIIFLHGIGQEKGFLDEIAAPFTKAGFAFVSFDQLMRGERRLPKEHPMWKEVKQFIYRPAYTINDTRRLIDYLETRSDIDPNRIYLMGASYGAITGSTVTAFDKRVKATVLCYGGGNIPIMLEARAVKKELGKLLPLAQMLAAIVLAPADPVNYVDKIAPTPVLFQNGTDDCLISTPARDALFEKAKEPKKRTIYPGDHIGLDVQQVFVVLDEGMKFIQEQDAKYLESIKKK